MRVLVRRNRPSTKQWTNANFDWIKRYGDEIVPGILRICTQREGKLVRKVKRQSKFNRQLPNHRVCRPLLRSLQIASISVPERPVTEHFFLQNIVKRVVRSNTNRFREKIYIKLASFE